ncbi:SDR family oxidoreductase [Acuticoccus sp.]|uniref:SDR family oxidoreductase n=1 Tax=Acuticoccus sp. TaxID=1904378 RepID=UPI003B51DB82
MRDPREDYPKPPFAKQRQPEPGLDVEMDPPVDHGEATYKGLGRMRGRKALITGGDSGIGRAVAIAYMREGADVVVNYLPEEDADFQELSSLASNEGGTIVGMPGDLTDEAFCLRLVKEAAEQLGGLDTLVINAGKQVFQESIADLTTEQFDRTLKTNCYAMFWLSKAALPLMPPGSAIINVTSILGYKPTPILLDYSATKFFIRGFTQNLAQQAIKQGVRVNAVAPGPFWTALQPSGGQPPEKLESFGEQTPMGRPGQPAELASTFVFLATQEAGYVVGETIGVTGGMPLA